MLPRHMPVTTEKAMKNLNQGNQPPGQDLNPGPREYEASMPVTPAPRSVAQ
jgi:hypothetical protein